MSDDRELPHDPAHDPVHGHGAADREHPIVPVPVPASLAPHVEGRRWWRDTVGESGGTVHRLRGGAGEPDLYLKHGRGAVADDLTDEMARLLWLGRHLEVPRVVQFLRDGDAAWLLMTALPGRTAWQCLDDDPSRAPAIVDALARHLRRLHAIPVEDCPFNSDHRRRLSCAKARMDAGLVDADDFDDQRAGWSVRRVWDEMTALLPLPTEVVVTHGDYSLDNLLLVDGEVTGCIDVGRAGLADRWQDLAILGNNLTEFGDELPSRLLQSYGLNPPGEDDERRRRFHLMLDEFF